MALVYSRIKPRETADHTNPYRMKFSVHRQHRHFIPHSELRLQHPRIPASHPIDPKSRPRLTPKHAPAGRAKSIVASRCTRLHPPEPRNAKTKTRPTATRATNPSKIELSKSIPPRLPEALRARAPAAQRKKSDADPANTYPPKKSDLS